MLPSIVGKILGKSDLIMGIWRANDLIVLKLLFGAFVMTLVSKLLLDALKFNY